jgi:hypothetical protein
MNSSVLLRPVIASAAAVAIIVIAGCGGTSPPQASASSASGSDPGIQAAYKFSACMRAHGVSGFPDPHVMSRPGSTSVGIKVDPALTGSPAFNSAQKACQGILPPPLSPSQQAAQQHLKAEHLLAFARCVRAHGVTNFPDPTAQGQLHPQMLAAAGVDLHAPNVIAAARACVPASGGAVSQAAISQATGSK